MPIEEPGMTAGFPVTRLRELIHEADLAIVEEWKWNTGVWSDHGPVCSMAPSNDHVKLNFFEGAALPDPQGLFNAGLDAKATRAIDVHEGDSINEPALKELIRAAIAINASGR